jgi:glycosyltransferase involved in cell wall biosynthesis
MKFSVAMCTYNGAQYLREQLESIAAQARAPDELVVCDDRSTDETVKEVEEFAARAAFPVRLYINEQTLGSTKNFERAIGLCGGEIIALSDQDDVWEVEKLKQIEAEFLTRPDVGLVFTDGEVVDQDLRPLGWRIWQTIQFNEKKQKLFREGKCFSTLLDRTVVTGATMAFRACFKELVLPIPTDVMHDGWEVIHDGWIALLIAAVAELAFIPEPLIKYRQHARQQLGVLSVLTAGDEQPSITGIAALHAAAQRRNFFGTEIHYFKSLYERLLLKGGTFSCGQALTELKARISHLEARTGMPERRLNRIPPVLKELLTLRYHLYSKGISSAIKDLWFQVR